MLCKISIKEKICRVKDLIKLTIRHVKYMSCKIPTKENM